MKKRSHLFVTGELACDISKRKRKWLLLGSILPDLLVHTYIKKHTWQSSFDVTVRRMQKLEEKGTGSWFAYLKLGYVLHYVEDFFTYPHNATFSGDFSEHVAYEEAVQRYLFTNGHIAEVGLYFEKEMVTSSEEAVDYLRRRHACYLAEAGTIETDIDYIREVSRTIGAFLVRAFAMNQMEEEELYIPDLAFAPHVQQKI